MNCIIDIKLLSADNPINIIIKRITHPHYSGVKSVFYHHSFFFNVNFFFGARFDIYIDLIEQKDKLDVINVHVQLVKKLARHGSLLPNTISDILGGFSASGKTNIIYKLITHADGLRFKNMYLYSMT